MYSLHFELTFSYLIDVDGIYKGTKQAKGW